MTNGNDMHDGINSRLNYYYRSFVESLVL